MSKDYYEILGVSKHATPEEMKKAYRKLSMALHPDRQAGKSDAEKKEAEEKFKDVNAAYACLSDPEKRARYDQFGTEDGPAGFGGGGIDPMEFFRKMHSRFGGFGDFDFDLIDQIVDGRLFLRHNGGGHRFAFQFVRGGEDGGLSR